MQTQASGRVAERAQHAPRELERLERRAIAARLRIGSARELAAPARRRRARWGGSPELEEELARRLVDAPGAEREVGGEQPVAAVGGRQLGRESPHVVHADAPKRDSARIAREAPRLHRRIQPAALPHVNHRSRRGCA